MDINKINILSYIDYKNLYSRETLKEYKSLFQAFSKNENFCKHGNLEKWKNILHLLPESNANHIDFSGSHIVLGDKASLGEEDKKKLQDLLLNLSPWRKGPFNICDIKVDSEWRSDYKWERLKGFIPNIADMRVADLGCSNGYYGYKLLGLNPELVVGMDKTALFIFQFLATKHFAKQIQKLLILPCSVEEFDSKNMDFNLILSMGVLYHVKNIPCHIDAVKKLIKKNGYLVLETIISSSEKNINIEQGTTYAGMKNIGTIFSKANLIGLLNASGFKNIELVNESFTSTNEQRTTRWMQGKSFKDFTLPNGRTIEGFPPVCRVIFVAQKK
jgi:tRNA (mo5U34)-methyltransferase